MDPKLVAAISENNRRLDKFVGGDRWRPTSVVTLDRTMSEYGPDHGNKGIEFARVGPADYHADGCCLAVEDSGTEIVLAEDSLQQTSIWRHGAGLRVPTPRDTLDEAVLVRRSWPQNYYHAVIDIAFTIWAIRSAGVEMPIIVPDTMMHQVCEYLAIADIGQSNILFSPEHDIRLSDAYVCSPSTPRRHLNEFRQDLVAGLRDSNVRFQSHSKLYLSRGDSSRRVLANELEIEEMMSLLGFRVIRCSTLQVSEQLKSIARATIVVAPHGAAMTNLLCATPGTTVFEVCPPHYSPNYFRNMLRLAGVEVEWHRLHGSQSDEAAAGDWQVKPDLLEESLQRAQIL